VALPPDSKLHHESKYCQQDFATFNSLLSGKIWVLSLHHEGFLMGLISTLRVLNEGLRLIKRGRSAVNSPDQLARPGRLEASDRRATICQPSRHSLGCGH
jgi:hypothetical protein